MILGQSNQQDLASPSGSATELTSAKSELARWEERAQQLEKRLADRNRELAELRADHERERAELKADRDRLFALIERMTAERRSIWQELRAWVARRSHSQ